MKRIPFVPPDDYYLEVLRPLDEELCDLLKRRRDLSDGKPGISVPAVIAEWAEIWIL